MALPPPSTLSVAAALFVALLSAVMAYLGWRSFSRTQNPRLVFVVVAFLVFMIKSLFVAYNVNTHAVPHDSIEMVSSLFDVIIVLMLFLPFFVRTER